MRRKALLIMLMAFFGLAFLVACGDQKDAEKSETKVTSMDVKEEAKEAIQTAKTYTQQQKEEYLHQLDAKIKEIDREMQELLAKTKSRAIEMKDESKAKVDQSLEELRNKKQTATEKLNELKSSSSEAWEEIKSGMDSAMDELNKAFDRARSEFKSWSQSIFYKEQIHFTGFAFFWNFVRNGIYILKIEMLELAMMARNHNFDFG